MIGSEAQLELALVAALLSVLALISSVFVWVTSRAKKVRQVEDQVLSELRAYKARAAQVDTQIGEWQVVVSGLLTQVEEFFERTVKERKRIVQQNAMANRGTDHAEPRDMSTMTRAEQLEMVDQHFRRLGR